MSNQLFIFLFSFLISNQILALNTNTGENTGKVRHIDSADSMDLPASPERTTPAPASPISTAAPSPAAPTPDDLSATDCCDTADTTAKTADKPEAIVTNWELILLDSPAGLAERVKFAQAYINALKNRNLQLASHLLNRACQQIDCAKLTASTDDIKVAVYQLDGICRHDGQTYDQCHECTDLAETATTPACYSTTDWQAMPKPCAAHFSDDRLNAMIDMLKISALVMRKASAVALLDPTMVRHRVAAACDYRVLRFLRVHVLIQKHVTSDNIAWLQSKILDQFCTIDTPDKPATPDVKSADSEDGANCDELCNTEWTILLA